MTAPIRCQGGQIEMGENEERMTGLKFRGKLIDVYSG